jgi:hypothetical protein
MNDPMLLFYSDRLEIAEILFGHFESSIAEIQDVELSVWDKTSLLKSIADQIPSRMPQE